MGTQTPPPEYNGTDFPQMPKDWSSDTNFDLGWIATLYSISNKTMSKIYGDYEFAWNSDKPLDLSGFNSNIISKNPGPIVYLAIWAAILLFFALVGCCWCVCANKCCCCCRSSFKGKEKVNPDEPLEDTDPHHQLRPNVSEKSVNKSKGLSAKATVILLLMIVWLAAFLTMILYAFASNDKTMEAIDQIEPDLEHAVMDAETYIGTARMQLGYVFRTGYGKLDEKLTQVFDACGIQCAHQKQDFEDAKDGSSRDVSKFAKSLEDALDDVKSNMRKAKNKVDTDYQESINDVNDGLYWLLYLFNILYCVIFGLVLIGTVLAGFGKTDKMKTTGFLVIRGAIVMMFIVGICAIVLLISMFVIAGLTSQIICPAVRSIEHKPKRTMKRTLNLKDGYKVPNVGEVIRACKNDESAYDAFHLEQVLSLDDIAGISKNFKKLGRALRMLRTISTRVGGVMLSPEDTQKEIKAQVKVYLDYVRYTIKHDVGKCNGAYRIINATVSLFCDKIISPISSFWFILQFIPLTFILIFVTALFFERAAS